MTVYNNVGTISKCLDSLIKAMEGLSFEMVIIDNYSNDGTFEVLLRYARQHANVRLYQYKCSRGLGKALAAELSRGDYVIPIVDPDSYVDPEGLHLKVHHYMKSKFAGKRAALGVIPRWIFKRVIWRDLNRAEDNEFNARLLSEDLVVHMPLKEKRYHHEIVPSIFKFMPKDWYREKRYARGLGYFSRFIKNKAHMVCGAAYSLKKVVREYRYANLKNFIYVIVAGFYHLFFITISRIMGLSPIELDPNLSNYLYETYKGIMDATNPAEFGFDYNEVEYPSYDDPLITYITRFHPDIIYGLERIYSWKKS
jgi:glycosyltransferase involved in cell wall biosynthesis